MKNTILLLCLLTASFGFSQQWVKQGFTAVSNDIAERAFVNDENMLKFIEFKPQHQFSSKEINARAERIFGLDPRHSFEFYRTDADNIGWLHHRFYRQYLGIRVEHDMYIFHEKDGKIIKANGELSSWFNESSSIPNIQENQASLAAELELFNMGGVRYGQMEDDISLVWLKVDDELKLCYKVDVFAANMPYRKWVYVNAHNGEVEKMLERIHTGDVPGTAITKYHGTQIMTVDSVNSSEYRLRETGRGGGVRTLDLNQTANYAGAVDFVDNDNFWNETANHDDAALDAHVGAEATYDYFFLEQGRNSYDNQGSELVSYIHYGVNYVNAFWNGSYMTYGDGGSSGFLPLTSVGIAGHEMAHGVTEFSAGLIYNAESGALNESFSDIFGTIVDFRVDPNNADFHLGDEINTNGTGIRHLGNPNMYNDPDTYHGLHWWTSSGDYYGVHTNSGVQNYWFYLLCEGGSGTNDNGDAFSVTPIGMEKAGDVSYRNLAFYLTPNSQYADAAFYGIESAIDLYTACGTEVISVTDAWNAVGIPSIAPGGQITASFVANGTNFCSAPIDVYFTNTTVGASSYEWDFGDGNTSTGMSPTHTYTSPGAYTVKLIVHTVNCGISDTLIKTNYISVNDLSSPVAPVCNPGSNFYSPNDNDGVVRFEMANVNNSSSNGSVGYEDFSCSHIIDVIENSSLPVTIDKGQSNYSHDIRMWIDMNTNGIFESSELILSADNYNNSQNAVFNLSVPTPPIYDSLMRLRVRVQRANNSNLPCDQAQQGQTEDYAIRIQQNTAPPVADFNVVKQTLAINETTILNEMCSNTVDTYEWSSEHGIFSSTTDPDPTVRYDSAGFYTVSLKVTNQFGEDSITKTAIIEVLNEVNLCEIDSLFGSAVFNDPGGSGNYDNNKSCELIIDIPCAKGIRLTADSYIILGGGDKIEIIDLSGPNEEVIFSHQSMALKTLNEGQVFLGMPLKIKFLSDHTSTGPGFRIPFEGISAAADFKPNLNVSSTVYAKMETAVSTSLNISGSSYFTEENTSIVWDFGDGSPLVSGTLTQTHTYENVGEYPVTLYLSNCSKDTVLQKNITVLRSGSKFANDIDVYPNPSDGNITIEESGQTPATLFQVTDPAGRLVHEYVPADENPVHHINLSHLAQGTYYLTVFYPNWTPIVKEIIISK